LPGGPTTSLTLDLPTALALAQGQNPRIALAQARVAQAQAAYAASRVLWLPSLRAGMNYNKHEGAIQDVAGQNILASRGAAFGGLGAAAVGAGSPAVPGIFAQFHLADALYQRQIAACALEAQREEATAEANRQLLETALAYLQLLEAHQRLAIAAQTLAQGQELARLTESFAQAGAVAQADVDRAEAAVALLRTELARAEEAVGVASTHLAQQLSVDPATTFLPAESTVVPLELIPVAQPPAELVAQGLSQRPELAASRALVCQAVHRLRREQSAVWLPSVAIGASYGAFAAGTGGQITHGDARFDFDSAAWWEVRQLGFGERAAREGALAQIEQARWREVESLDRVAREIVESLTQVRARQRQIAMAEEGIAAAQRSYQRNLERIRHGQGLPLEALQAIQALDAAQRDYLRAVIDYNAAQFRLVWALGWPVQDVGSEHRQPPNS
jgi:outer membrane protein TolC